MIAIDKKIVENVINNNSQEINNQHQKAYNALKKLYNQNNLPHEESLYLKSILKKFKEYNLVTIPPEELPKITSEIGEVRKKKIKFNGSQKKTYFKDEILKALDYTGKRNEFYPNYFNQIGIKACVYCNSQLTLNIEIKQENKKKERKYIGRYQVDHYYPKSKFPFLSIALFNLYPVCASCNLAKRENHVDFQLYENSGNIDFNQMSFRLDQSKKAKFVLSRDIKDISYKFHNRNNPKYDNIFHINEIYKTQKDIAEEIFLKSLAYDRNLRKHLIETGIVNDAIINRIILGTYASPHDVHKRPMSKFMQDIGKEVGLI